MKYLILTLLVAFTFTVNAQFEENFSDGDFTNNPTWSGNTTHYIVNAENELQLNNQEASGTTVSYLSTVAATADMTTWEFFVRLDFSPSTSNFARVYLKSNLPDLTADVQGYFIKIGGISGSDDTVELWRQDGADEELLISGTVGAVGGSSVIARIKVERNADANWTLSADYTGGSNFTQEGTANDATYNLTGYFGYWNKYTATRKDKFFLDDISINPLFVDMQAPVLQSAEAQNSTTVLLSFDEPVQGYTAQNFTINNGVNVTEATPDAQDASKVLLTVSPAFQNFQNYTVTASSVMDSDGNVLAEDTANFNFLEAEAATLGDILITEIMADPSPVVGLPNVEFIEIYNNSNKAIALQSLYVVSDASPDQLSEGLIMPGEYYVVCDDDDVSLFSSFGNVAFATTFPALSNAEDFVMIQREDALIIDEVEYTDSWYQDDIKEDGGWTLERVDLNSSNECSENWRASVAPIGGTPSAENSVNGQFLNPNPPAIVSVVSVDEFSVLVTFDKAPDEAEAKEEANYSIDNGASILSASLEPDKKTVRLVFTQALLGSVNYTLTISNALSDCLGNMFENDQTATFLLGEEPAYNDVVINEILFNPRTGGADYVEFYNRSSKVINLMNTAAGQVIQMYPQTYAVISEKPDTVSSRFNVENPQWLYEADLPTLADEAGVYTLYSQDSTIIDVVFYTELQQYALLRDENGVALERINPDKPSTDLNNWHSAAETVGYGTPTYKNSQFFQEENPIDTNNFLNIPVARISPDEDGFEDVLLINFDLDNTGYSANIKIFDAQGRQVKILAENTLLPTSGTIKWDGSTDDKFKARVGIYVVWAQIFNPNGEVKEEKKAIVVAGKL